MNNISEALGRVISQAVETAEVVYKDKGGNELFRVPILGKVNPGDKITTQVPAPEDFTVMVSTPR
jgi:hypothetical protein